MCLPRAHVCLGPWRDFFRTGCAESAAWHFDVLAWDAALGVGGPIWKIFTNCLSPRVHWLRTLHTHWKAAVPALRHRPPTSTDLDGNIKLISNTRIVSSCDMIRINWLFCGLVPFALPGVNRSVAPRCSRCFEAVLDPVAAVPSVHIRAHENLFE